MAGWTLSSLTTAIEDYTQNTETTFVSHVTDFITLTEDRINKAIILPNNRTGAAPTVTSGTATITLPTDFLAPFALQFIQASTYTTATIMDVSFIREAYPVVATTGLPKYYAMQNDTTLIVGPTPTTGITASLLYFYKPASITTALTSWVGTNAPDCLLYGCLSEAYGYMKGEDDLQKLYEGRFQTALASLAKLGEGLDLGDAFRMGDVRLPRGPTGAST